MRSVAIVALSALLGLSAQANAAEPAEPKELFCSSATEGTSKFVVDTRLHVLEETKKPSWFQYKPAKGPRAFAIMCRRSSIVPAVNDHKVVDAGFLFFIQTADATGRTRLMQLAKPEGRYQIKMMSGRLAPQEQKLIDERLRRFQQVAAQAAR